MMSEIFTDTNILVYSVDKHDMAKQDRCRESLRWLDCNGCGVISTQVMQEFYVASTKKLKIDPMIAKWRKTDGSSSDYPQTLKTENNGHTACIFRR